MAYANQNPNLNPVAPTLPPGLMAKQTFFGQYPVKARCDNCHVDVITKRDFKIGQYAWCMCCMCVAMYCWCGCCLIPFCTDGCKDVNHYCPNCGNLLGQLKRNTNQYQ